MASGGLTINELNELLDRLASSESRHKLTFFFFFLLIGACHFEYGLMGASVKEFCFCIFLPFQNLPVWFRHGYCIIASKRVVIRVLYINVPEIFLCA